MNPILDYLCSRSWAVHEPILSQLTMVVSRHVEGVKVSHEEVSAIVAERTARRRALPRTLLVEDGVGIIPISGVIARHASQVNGCSQPRGTSAEQISRDLREALEDPEVTSLLLDIDSPGGTVSGVPELADELAEAGREKPLFAMTDGMMASAAYWLGSQAQEIYATRSATVGSIGVYAAIVDSSVAAHNQGLKIDVVKTGEAKAAGIPGTPTTDRHRASVMADIQSFFEMFKADVSQGRGDRIEDLDQIADGSVFIGAEARRVGLVDSILTMKAIRERVASVAAPNGRTVVAMSPPGKDCAVTQETTTANAESDTGDQVSAATQVDPTPKESETAASAEAMAGAIAQERLRAAKILNAAGPEQQVLAQGLIESGASVEEAFGALLKDHKESGAERVEAAREAGKKEARIEDLYDGAPESPGSHDAEGESSGPRDAAQAWKADPVGFQRGFGSFECFEHYWNAAVADGRDPWASVKSEGTVS